MALVTLRISSPVVAPSNRRSGFLALRPPGAHQLMHDNRLDTQCITHTGKYVCVSDLEYFPVTRNLELGRPFPGLVEAQPDVDWRSWNARPSDPQESVGTGENAIVWAHSIRVGVVR